MEHIADYLRYADFERGFLQLSFTLFLLAMVMERFYQLFLVHRRATECFVDQAAGLLRTGQLEEARRLCTTTSTTIESRLMVTMLDRGEGRQSAMSAALEEALLDLRPPLFHRLRLLPALGLVSTLTSLTCAFGVRSYHSPYSGMFHLTGQREILMIRGLAEGMPASVVWTGLALFAYLCHLVLVARARSLAAGIDRMEGRIRVALELPSARHRFRGGTSSGLQPTGRRTGAWPAPLRRLAERSVEWVNSPPLPFPLTIPPVSSVPSSLPALFVLQGILLALMFILVRFYNTTPSVNLSRGLNPPASMSTLPIREAITVAITPDDISVDDRRVMTVPSIDSPDRERSPGGVPAAGGAPGGCSAASDTGLDPLLEALLARVEHHKKIEEMGGPRFKGNVLIVADRAIPYGLLHQVLCASGEARLPNAMLVTVGP